MRFRELNVGCFGGGTGLPSLLGGLKRNPWLSVHAVVTMFDSKTPAAQGNTIAYSTFLDKVDQGTVKDSTRLWVTRSTDKGATWKTLCEDVPWTGDEGEAVILLDEPDVIECDDGTLVGMARFNEDPAHPDDHYLRQTVSHDGGRTWTPTQKINVIGFPPHLLKLPDGKLVCVYGRRTVNPGYGEFAVISDDNGKTWDVENEVVLCPFFNDDLGYPSSCLLANGDILTVYYQPEKLGEKPCLMATKWRVTR